MVLPRSVTSLYRTSRALNARGANPVNRVFGHDRFGARSNAQVLQRDKPHVNSGTIGHGDHGKATLTAAITKRGKEASQYLPYTSNIIRIIDTTPTSTAPATPIFVKNMIIGAANMDGAVVVVAVSNGQTPQTREYLLLARQVGVQKIVVFVNKVDVVQDKGMLGT